MQPSLVFIIRTFRLKSKIRLHAMPWMFPQNSAKLMSEWKYKESGFYFLTYLFLFPHFHRNRTVFLWNSSSLLPAFQDGAVFVEPWKPPLKKYPMLSFVLKFKCLVRSPVRCLCPISSTTLPRTSAILASPHYNAHGFSRKFVTVLDDFNIATASQTVFLGASHRAVSQRDIRVVV